MIILLELLQNCHWGFRSQFEFWQQYVERFKPSGIHVEWLLLLYINGNTQPLTSKWLFYSFELLHSFLLSYLELVE
jgi:hypothetical protein